MPRKKRGRKYIKIIIVVAIIIAILLICSLIFIKNRYGNIQLSPSQPTQVSVQVGNAVPTVTNMQAIANVNLNPAPSTTNVIFTFTARDANGASDLSDLTASAQFTNPGETTRQSPCIFLSTLGKEKTYQCTVAMSYYDKSGLWTVTVNVADTKGAIAQSLATFTVNLLRDISITPSVITFPVVAPNDVNVITTDKTTITNNGNFEAPPGTISVTSFDLTGETTSTEKIPAANFKSVGSSQIDVCGQGNALISSSTVVITTSKLARGATGNTEKLSYCLTSVPEISSQYYSAKGGSSWIVAIN